MKSKRSYFGFVGDRTFLFRTYATVFWLVFLTATMVVVSNVVILSAAGAGIGVNTKLFWQSLVFAGAVNLTVSLLISAAVVAVYAHRVAGPMYRIQSSLERVMAGDRDISWQFRPLDFFSDIGKNLGLVMERFSTQLSMGSGEIQEAQKLLSTLSEELVQGKTIDHRSVISKLQVISTRLSEADKKLQITAFSKV